MKNQTKGSWGNMLTGIPAALPEEFLETLASSSSVRIERIVSRGHHSPPDFWYNQSQNEFVLLIQGEARLEYPGEAGIHRLSPGDWLVIPSHRKHRVAWTSETTETVWLAVFFGDTD